MQDKRTLKQKHAGLHTTAKHMQHVVEGVPHARELAHELINHNVESIGFLLGRQLQGQVILQANSRFDL